jgi:hypothetical protein
MNASALFRLGWATIAAGLVGAVAAVYLVVIEPAVTADRYSYPLSPGGFATIQVFFAVHHLGLLAGLYGLWRSDAIGDSRSGRSGAVGAIGGMGLLTLTELLVISAADAAYPSSQTEVMDVLYGVSSLVIAVGLIVAGIAVLRAGRWRGWRRIVPLALGVYVIVPMAPMLMASHDLARFGIGGWMLGFAALGWTLVVTAGHQHTERSIPTKAGDLR